MRRRCMSPGSGCLLVIAMRIAAKVRSCGMLRNRIRLTRRTALMDESETDMLA